MLRLAIDFLRSPQKFKPSEILYSFPQITVLAKAKQPEVIIFDKDDTLTKLHQFQIVDEKIKQALSQLRKMRIKMYIVSNSVKQGDPGSVEGIPILRTINKKPYNSEQVRAIIGRVSNQKVWMIGDRLMTDVYLANKMGIRSALLPPLQKSTVEKHGIIVCLLRRIEGQYISLMKWA